MIPTLSTELSDREIYLIGSIVTQWGFLEAEIFNQTLMSFEDGEPLHKSMNNSQFTNVLSLWHSRVLEQQSDDIKLVLQGQYDEIRRLNDFRQAVVHSRWEWHPDQPDVITATRVHKKSLKQVRFTAEDLFEFSTQLGRIRFLIRYPNGLEQRAEEMSQSGGYISRRGWDILSGRANLEGE